MEGQDGSGIIRHSMIRPGSEVEMIDTEGGSANARICGPLLMCT